MASEARSLTDLEREFLPPALEIIETAPSPMYGAVIWSTFAFFAAMILWACLSTVDVVAMAPGKFIPDGRVKELQPLESSIVRAIHVKEGQHVNKGDLLLELDPTLSAADLAANTDKYGFNQLEQQRLTAELTQSRPDYTKTGEASARIRIEEQMRRARQDAYASKLQQAVEGESEKEAALDAALATLDKYRESVAIDTQRESSAGPLADTGAISRDDYLQLRQDLVKDKHDLAAQANTVQQARAAVSEAQKAIEQVKHDRQTDIYKDLDQEIAQEPALKGDLDKAQRMYDLKWMRAPVSGTVQAVNVTTLGQVVTPAQSLVTIVPDGTPLIIEATVTNQDIGYVKVGQKVDVKVDTFPFQKYGSLKGTLTWVSPDAEDKSAASKDADTRTGEPRTDPNQQAENQNAGYVYKVHIRMDGERFSNGSGVAVLQPGMTVQADIKTDRRRIISFVLSPVVKYLNEGASVR